MPDPKLKAAMREISDVLERNDIAGFICIQTADHAEYLCKLNASWNAITYENGFFRLRVKQAEYPNKEAAKKALENGIGTVAALVDAMKYTSAKMEELLVTLAKQVEFSNITRHE